MDIQVASKCLLIETKACSYSCPAAHFDPHHHQTTEQVYGESQKSQHQSKSIQNAVFIKYAFDNLCS